MLGAGPIETRLGINLGPYEAGMRKAASEANGLANQVAGAMGGFSSKVANLIKSPIAQVGATIGAALSIREITGRISEAMENIDKTAKAADVAGLTTEAYIGLAHAADLAGVESASLEMGLRKLQTNLIDATAGAGEAGDALAKMGLDAGALLSAGPEAAIGNIADALNRLPAAAERSAAAAKIFGERAGPELLNLLAGGSEAIRQSAAEAEKLGMMFSRFDAAKVEQANDSITKIQHAVDAISNSLAVSLAPTIQAVADGLIQTGTEGSQGWGKFQSVADGVNTAMGYGAELLKMFEAGWLALKIQALFVVGGVLKGIDLLGDGVTGLINLIPGVNVQWETVGAMADSVLKDATHAVGDYKKALGDALNFKPLHDMERSLRDTTAKSNATAKETAENAQKMRGAYEGAGKAVDETAKKLADLQKQMQDIGRDIAFAGNSIGAAMTDAMKAGMAPADMQKLAQMMSLKEQIGRATKPMEIRQLQAQAMPLVTEGMSAGEAGRLGQWMDFAAQQANLRGVDDALKGMREEVDRLSKTDLERAFDGLIPTPSQQAEILAMSDRLKELRNLVEMPSTGNFMDDFAAQMERLNDAVRNGIIDLGKFNELADAARQTLNSKLDDSARSIIESVKTPFEKFNEQMMLLDNLRDTNRLNDEQFKLAQKQAEDALGGDQLRQAEQKVAFVDARSAEAQAMRFGNTSTNPMAGVIKEQKTGNEYLRNIESAMQRLDLGTVVEV